MAEFPSIEVGAEPVSLSPGLTIGDEYLCEVHGDAIMVYSAALAPDPAAVYGVVYGDHAITRKFNLTPEAAVFDWAWTVGGSDGVVVSRRDK